MTLTQITETADIRLVMVASVDNEDEPCGYCDTEARGVQANIYLSCPDGEIIECCLSCVVPQVRENAEAGQRLLVEVAL